MEAIFVQSFDKEIKSKKLESLLIRIFENLKNKNMKVFVFLNLEAIKVIDTISLPTNANINFIYIDEEEVANPTTSIFQFLINYKIEEFEKILILESDCFLFKDFDEKLNNFIRTSPDLTYWPSTS